VSDDQQDSVSERFIYFLFYFIFLVELGTGIADKVSMSVPLSAYDGLVNDLLYYSHQRGRPEGLPEC